MEQTSEQESSLQSEMETIFAQKREELSQTLRKSKKTSEQGQYASIPVGQYNPKYLPSENTKLPISVSQQPKGGFALKKSREKNDSSPEVHSRYDNMPTTNGTHGYVQPLSPSYVTAMNSTAGELVVGECQAKFEYHADGLPVCYWNFRSGDRFLLMQSLRDEADGWYRVHKWPDTHASAQVSMNALSGPSEKVSIGFVPVAYMNVKKYPRLLTLHSCLCGLLKQLENGTGDEVQKQGTPKKYQTRALGSPVARRIHNPPPTSRNGYRNNHKNYASETRYDADI
ncbi:hypothetical protein Ciccas_002094 [Cichlidogyrus casuarinus]|uniref:Uncharacterized protein n=1 Tax=Cichlidogyrus casuarinus TaxID=1844966 RepID=A0ABD2QI65_9PLAT